MATIQDKIAQLEAEHKKRIDQLKAKDELIQARKVQALIKGKRADETRRKILAGALVLEMMGENDETKNRFIARLDKFLTRADDRALFGLAPRLDHVKNEMAEQFAGEFAK